MGVIKAVIFDLDGVLVDTGDWHYQALSRALSEHGFTLTREEHERHYEGLPTREKLKLMSRLKGLPAELYSSINALKQRYTIELVAGNCRPCGARTEMLRRLKAEGYKLAAASNSTRETIAAALSGSGLAGYFDFYLGNQDVPKSKPDPRIYLEAFLRLKLAPAECLVVEDHPAGLKAAYGSGAHVARVRDIKEVCYAFVKERIIAAARGTDLK